MKHPRIKFEALFAQEDSGVRTVRFEITDAEGDHVGSFDLDVEPTGLGTTDGILAVAHRRMAEIAKQWAGQLTDTAVEFEQR